MSRKIVIPLIALSAHGGTRILVEFANFAAQRGEEVEILLPKGRNSKTYPLDPRVCVTEFPLAVGLKFVDYFLFLLFIPLIMRRGVVLANFFVTYPSAWLSRLLFGTALIYFVQDMEDVRQGAIGALLNLVCRLTYRSRHIVAANSFLKVELIRRGAKPLGAIQLGPSQSFFSCPREKEKNLFDVVCFPRHEPRKGAKRLELVIALYQEIFGPLKTLCISQDLVMAARFEALGCTWLKPANEAELIAGLDRARVLLFTSYKDGFGLPPLEGMARGLPPVVYACGGSSLYMEDGVNGYLIVDDNRRAVTSLHRLLNDAPLYEEMRDNALATASKFSLMAGLDALLSFCVAAAGRGSV